MPTPREISYYTANLLDRCHKCFGSLANAKSKAVDSIDHIVCEEETVCGHCNEKVDYWAYGQSEREMEVKHFEEINPKAAEMLKEMVKK